MIAKKIYVTDNISQIFKLLGKCVKKNGMTGVIYSTTTGYLEEKYIKCSQCGFFFFKIEQAVQVNYRFSEGEIIM